jgi:hypothetical protein
MEDLIQFDTLSFNIKDFWAISEVGSIISVQSSDPTTPSQSQNSALVEPKKRRLAFSPLERLKLLQCVCLNAKKIINSRSVKCLNHPNREGKLSKGFYKLLERYINNFPDKPWPTYTPPKLKPGYKRADGIRSHLNKVLPKSSHPPHIPPTPPSSHPFPTKTQSSNPNNTIKLTNIGTFTQHYYSLNPQKQSVDFSLTLIPNESACLSIPNINWLVPCHRLSTENLQLPQKFFFELISSKANWKIFEVNSGLKVKEDEFKDLRVGDDLVVRVGEGGGGSDGGCGGVGRGGFPSRDLKLVIGGVFGCARIVGELEDLSCSIFEERCAGGWCVPTVETIAGVCKGLRRILGMSYLELERGVFNEVFAGGGKESSLETDFEIKAAYFCENRADIRIVQQRSLPDSKVKFF